MSVYRYFGTKDGLVIAVWRDALTQFYEKIHGAVHGSRKDSQNRL